MTFNIHTNGRDTERINGKFIQVWIYFPVIGSSSWPGKLKFWKIVWMSFPGFGYTGEASKRPG